ncbi:conserved oligomeric Golgi complex subunit 7 isoform X2 [Bicyclus anynana]|uniref:Conserved oligomeric Golgi complex subunit 7 n=1 Tax=Bicyclus anynana TaxID=110368 RepID=A0ABM3M2L5_BICAN|nr:conserved oligomeric Golgi complex subunit 7 isoform X2 [Bicyclus anynana]
MVFVGNTVARLQLYMKQLSNSLDETTTQIVSSVPRILQDASGLQLEGAMLQQKLVTLEQQVQGVEEQTGHSIQSLQRIDQLKSSLENAASALREADKWVALATSLEEVLESGVPTQKDKLAELAEQVTAMTASLEVLSDSPDYEVKRVQLETLYNRLEAAITPPFVDALTQMDAERTRAYVRVFVGMSRSASACRCWRRAAGARLALGWRHELRPLADSAPQQVEWLTSVLRSETPLAELLQLYTDLLQTLEPSPTKIATATFKLCQSPDEGLAVLMDIRTDIDEFINCIRNVIDAPRPNKGNIPLPTRAASGGAPLLRDIDRAACKNQLMTKGPVCLAVLMDIRTDIDEFINCIRNVIDAPRPNKEELRPAALRALGRAAYAPLRELMPKYTDIQTTLFLARLVGDNQILKQDDLLEYSRTMLLVAERSEGLLHAAYNRGRNIAGPAVYPFYSPAVEAFASGFLNLITSHMRHIESSFLSSVNAGERAGVLSDTFPASLVLESAVAQFLSVLAERQRVEEADGVSKPQHPLLDLSAFLLESDARDTARAPPPSVAGLRRAKDALRNLARSILRNPIDKQLDKIPQLSVWYNNDALSTDLPDFALSPQEYITEIGQYLMTLPQHLEMHLSEKQAPWQFLSELCTHTCEMYAQKILNIRNMDALGTKRCLTDMMYLSSVVDDLGGSVTPALKTLEHSLRASAPGDPAH